jgi:DNA-binding response OmpR family regulator/S1-C subfamily serine protease
LDTIRNAMNIAREKIVVLESDAASRDGLQSALQAAGYDVISFATRRDGIEAARQPGIDLLVLDVGIHLPDTREILAEMRGAAATEGVRLVLLTGATAQERAEGLDLGADDAISRPWDTGELLARVRAQLRIRRAEKELLEKMHIAEEGQQIAHTAFEALAVTEKMTNDAVSLDHRLKFGVTAVLVVAALMAGIYFLFAHNEQKQTQRSNAIIAKLEGGIVREQDLLAKTRKARETQGPGVPAPVGKAELQAQASDLKAKMANASSDEVTALQSQLAETNARLKRVEQEGDSAQNMIPMDVRSVCLLHVAVGFRDQQSGQRLRYAGLNPKGEPLQDSDGNPILTTSGNGPEVKLDVFGTGFLAGQGGRLITNRHVAEPWWKNDELAGITGQGFQAEISSIHAYFPGDARTFTAEIQQISQDTDLAAMRADLQDLKRSTLSIDSEKTAALTGTPIVVMGYATGLDAILARTDEDTAQQIIKKSGGDVSQILDELAHRNLIRPLITQGHIGDVLPDKIVFDAQTTSGGSGGPVFNQQGKVIGVTYAILKGFGGSNFGIPIRFSQPLLTK